MMSDSFSLERRLSLVNGHGWDNCVQKPEKDVICKVGSIS